MRYPMGTEKQLLGCAQLISATKSSRRFQIENEGELDHEKLISRRNFLAAMGTMLLPVC